MESKFHRNASPAITEAMDRATRVFKLCPNRVWAVGRNLPGWEAKLPQLIPPVRNGKKRMKIVGHQGHEYCTFDFCEYSMLNFTNVKQRHERASCATIPCDTIKDKFSRATLNEAAHAGKPTAWRLDSMSMVEFLEPFMAISHVWSDGTGAGEWPDGEVNSCLYSFFEDIARRFDCKGIWWDTICIPTNKVARAKAIGKMQQNYENAQITLVHDCYIRQWEWIDAETACLAIIMSPWFSRGWTALELAKSKRVKVIFKGSVIKDLDIDILSKSPADSPRHKIASGVIVNLRRKRIETVNDLLAVLASRSTSWHRDMAVIAALLMGINIPKDASQQGIYKALLHHFGDIRQGHLFHRSATMSGGFSWCPTNLLDMPMAPAKTRRECELHWWERAPGEWRMPISPAKTRREGELEIDRWGRAMGKWRIIEIDSVPLDNYILEDAHPLTRVKLALALKSPDDHILLAESGHGRVSRALVVKSLSEKVHFSGVLRRTGEEEQDSEEEPLWDSPRMSLEGSSAESSDESSEEEWYLKPHEVPREKDISRECPTAYCYQLIGPVHFCRPLTRREACGNLEWVTRPICIGDILEAHKNKAEIEREIKKLRKEFKDLASGWITDKRYRRSKSVLWEIETLTLEKYKNEDYEDAILYGLQPPRSSPDNTSGEESVSASEKDRGHGKHKVKEHRSRSFVVGWGDANERIFLVEYYFDLSGIPAARVKAGQQKEMIKPQRKQKAGLRLMQALQNGDQKRATSALCSTAERHLGLKDAHGRTVLHYAAWRGYHRTVEDLLDTVDVGIADRLGQQAFHLAAGQGHKRTIKLFLEHIDQHRPCGNGQTWLHRAVLGGSLSVVGLILTKFHAIDHQDLEGRTALHWAVLTRHSEIIKLLLSKGANKTLKDASGRTVLHLAAMSGDLKDDAIGLLLGTEALNVADGCGRIPLHYAAERGFVSLATLLHDGTDLDMQDSNGDTALHLAFRNGHEEVVVRLLEMGARPNVPNSMGKSTLHLAASAGQSEIVLALVQHGADVWMEDRDNATPIMMAAENGHHGATAVLAEHVLKGVPHVLALEFLSPFKLTLHDAAQYGCPVLTEKLLRSGANIHERNASGMTPLTLAVQRRAEGVVEILLLAYGVRYWDLAEWFEPAFERYPFLHQSIDSIRNYAKADEQFARQMDRRYRRFQSTVSDLREARLVAQENDDLSMELLLASFYQKTDDRLYPGRDNTSDASSTSGASKAGVSDDEVEVEWDEESDEEERTVELDEESDEDSDKE